MTPALFSQAGQLLFGHDWREPLAKALEVSPTSVRRWAKGKPIPDGVVLDLIDVCEEKSLEIQELRALLAQFAFENALDIGSLAK